VTYYQLPLRQVNISFFGLVCEKSKLEAEPEYVYDFQTCITKTDRGHNLC